MSIENQCLTNNVCVDTYSPTGYDDEEYVFPGGVGEVLVTYTAPGDYVFTCTVNDTMGNIAVETTESEVKERMNQTFLLKTVL